jgi:hypothetical protein
MDVILVRDHHMPKSPESADRHRRKPERPDAVAAFKAAKASFDTRLKRLTALSTKNFNVDTQTLDYAHLGTMRHLDDLLKHVTDFAFNEER